MREAGQNEPAQRSKYTNRDEPKRREGRGCVGVNNTPKSHKKGRATHMPSSEEAQEWAQLFEAFTCGQTSDIAIRCLATVGWRRPRSED